jgi:ABC-2 type transport system ATP-binding protein
VLEASGAHRGRTGRTHLRVLAAAAGIPRRRVDEVLDLVGLAPAANRTFKSYSLGMRQRLGIAAALLGDPAVLLLDEPANGLDPEGIRWMRDTLRWLAAQGRTVLVSSHLLSEMQVLADDVAIIAKGRLVKHGPVTGILDGAAAGPRVRVRTPSPDPLLAALTAPGIGAETTPDGELVLTGVTAVDVGRAALAAGVELHQLVTERADLERAFLSLTAGRADIR